MTIIHHGYVVLFFYRHDAHGVQVLLQKKDRGWRGADLWTPFGGGIEEGETPEIALVREIREEIGVDVLPEHLEHPCMSTTYTKAGAEVPLHAYATPFTYPLDRIRLTEGCGWALWYVDELPMVPMQPHEKKLLLELIPRITQQ